VAVQVFPNARRPEWPEAEFIVGNPPFIGGANLRSRMESGFAEALWRAHPHVNESADFVMYWWDRAAELLTRKKTPLRRFGLVTTNSISQVFQRRVMERHLNAKAPVSIIFAVPDHPWSKASSDSAAVRIAMTVSEAGVRDGTLSWTTSEAGLETDAPEIVYGQRKAKINADLTVGVDATSALSLQANQGVCFRGIIFLGDGFILSPEDHALLLASEPQSASLIRTYRSGRDLSARVRGVTILDPFGLDLSTLRQNHPAVFSRLAERVQPVRAKDRRASYRDNWWYFAEARPEFRERSVRCSAIS
jgi:hypothetical protein